ncbi:hypothetical protein BC829DRAFT_419348 [Chytridium lagenaria]|nr:hypothetical protein BC829DRAFT_419348 [Chytridium lagenaria]
MHTSPTGTHLNAFVKGATVFLGAYRHMWGSSEHSTINPKRCTLIPRKNTHFGRPWRGGDAELLPTREGSVQPIANDDWPADEPVTIGARGSTQDRETTPVLFARAHSALGSRNAGRKPLQMRLQKGLNLCCDACGRHGSWFSQRQSRPVSFSAKLENTLFHMNSTDWPADEPVTIGAQGSTQGRKTTPVLFARAHSALGSRNAWPQTSAVEAAEGLEPML